MQEKAQIIIHNMEIIGKSLACRNKDKGTVTNAQLKVLFAVAGKGASTVKDLAKRFHLTPSAITQLVNALVEEKLLTRVEDQADRRRISLKISSRGQKEIALSKERWLKIVRQAFATLNPSEYDVLEKIQQKIIKQLSNQ